MPIESNAEKGMAKGTVDAHFNLFEGMVRANEEAETLRG